MKATNIFTQVGIIAAIIVVLNLISDNLYFRLDFTEDRRYTLSNATKQILKDLDEVISVKAYFTAELPPQLAYVQQDLQDQLIEYEDLSDGNVVFEFINPNESEELKQQAFENGIAPVSINVVENDQRQQLQAFMGVTFQMGDRKEVIPLVQPGAAMEYDLTTSIKKLAIQDKPKIGMIQGFGEPSFQSFTQLMQQLTVLYDVEPFNLADTSSIPMYYRSLIWISPSDSIGFQHLQKIDDYLNNGGNLFLAKANVKGDLQTGALTQGVDIGLARWMIGKGIEFGNEFVIDAQCASVTVQQRSGFFTINSQVEFPYFPQISTFTEHPTTGGLEALLLPFTNPIRIIGSDTSLNITPLLLSSDLSGIQRPPAYVDIQRQWNENDFQDPGQVVAASVEGIGMGGGKIIVISNGEFVVNGEGQQAQQVNPDNVNFASNAVDWLSDDTGLIDLRTKGITNRPLDSVEDSTKNLVKYGNVFAPILLILIYAVVRRSINARRRHNWAQGKYQ